MSAAPVPVILDSDAGIDDAVALALAARSPEVVLLAVTTSFGNARLADTTANVRHALSLAGRGDVPVLPGADGPLTGQAPPPSANHGPAGMGYAAGGADSHDVRGSRTALLEALALAPSDRSTVLVTLGPLTNLAHALERDAAGVRARLARHLAVIDPPPAAGETDPPPPDFNSAADPEAVRRVFGAGLPTDVVPPAVTRRLVIPGGSVGHLRRSADPLVRWLTDALRWYVEVHARLHGVDGCWVHDAVAVAEAVRPGTLDFAPRGAEIGPRVARDFRLHAARSLLDRVFGPGWNGTPTGGT
jgi:pyrimidine-specific ribonucleoside hydrolase